MDRVDLFPYKYEICSDCCLRAQGGFHFVLLTDVKQDKLKGDGFPT